MILKASDVLNRLHSASSNRWSREAVERLVERLLAWDGQGEITVCTSEQVVTALVTDTDLVGELAPMEHGCTCWTLRRANS